MSDFIKNDRADFKSAKIFVHYLKEKGAKEVSRACIDLAKALSIRNGHPRDLAESDQLARLAAALNEPSIEALIEKLRTEAIELPESWAKASAALGEIIQKVSAIEKALTLLRENLAYGPTPNFFHVSYEPPIPRYKPGATLNLEGLRAISSVERVEENLKPSLYYIFNDLIPETTRCIDFFKHFAQGHESHVEYCLSVKPGQLVFVQELLAKAPELSDLARGLKADIAKLAEAVENGQRVNQALIFGWSALERALAGHTWWLQAPEPQRLIGAFRPIQKKSVMELFSGSADGYAALLIGG